MSLTSFPEPPDLKLRFEDTITDGKNISMSQYSVENPHPGYGKDPNILNELGHTKYPMYVKNAAGESVIVNNADEEAEVVGKPETKWEGPKLREDGPTVHEYVAAGYKAKNYPPEGWASKSTQQEIDLAIAEEETAEAKAATGWGK